MGGSSLTPCSQTGVTRSVVYSRHSRVHSQRHSRRSTPSTEIPGGRMPMHQVPDTFHVASYPREGHAVIEVHGDIDLQSAPLLRQALLDCAEQGDLSIILDLEQVDFLDSTGLSAIIAGLRAMQNRQGCLMLAGIAPQIQRLLDLTHLNEEFRVFPTVADAIATGTGKEPSRP